MAKNLLNALHRQPIKTIVIWLDSMVVLYCESGEEEVLTPNVLIRGRNTYLLDDIENDVDELTKMQKRIAKAKNNAWKRWQREYVHSLMESQRVNGKPVNTPEGGEVVLVVGEEKNRSEWKKGKVVRQVKGKDGV
ncbi:Hypothetical predicted protein, partial [Paramuricea clavata]